MDGYTQKSDAESANCETIANNDKRPWTVHQGMVPDLARAYAFAGSTLAANRTIVFRRRANPVCRACAFGDRTSFDDRDRSLAHLQLGSRRTAGRDAFDHARHRCDQHRLWICFLPAARLADPRGARPQGILEDSALHAGVLDDDVARRLAGALAALVKSAPLGEDSAFQD